MKKEALWMIKSVDKKVSTRAVAIRGKLWQPGDTIRIKFLNDPYNLEEQVKQTAAKWLKYINLYFKYVGTNEEADVKIGFSDDRYISWSTIGTDCREIAQDSVSLNFSGFGDNLLYEPELITSDILRGFGHVLGLGFEYKNPLSTIEFNENVTDEQIYGEYHLFPEEIKEFRQLYDSSQTNYTSYDRFSIMCIDIPRALVPRPQATHYNTEFSGNDTTFIAKLYPCPVIEDTIPSFDPQVNIDALNAYIANSELSTFHVIIGFNYDQNEKLPFVASDRKDSVWIGYVSKGRVYCRKYPYKIYSKNFIYNFDYYKFYSFIYKNNFHTTLEVLVNENDRNFEYMLSIYGIDTLMVENFNLHGRLTYNLPMTLEDKIYLGGVSEAEYGNMYLDIYNLTDKKIESRYLYNWLGNNVNPPVGLYSKDNYMYFAACNHVLIQDTLWIFRASLENPHLEKIGYPIIGRGDVEIYTPFMINGKFYIKLSSGEVIDIENDFGRVIYSDYKDYTIAYGNKLYWTDPKNSKSHYVMVKDFNE